QYHTKKLRVIEEVTMPYARIITIDGPAGCGKTTLGYRLAEELNYSFLDSGILYRAITRHVMNVGAKPHQLDSVQAYTETLTLTIKKLRPRFQFEINGKKVSKLNSLQIDKLVPIIAAYPFIREKVRAMQREIAAQGQVIIAGRDIGTVILPDADLKIYLDVSLEERAVRRHAKQNTEERSLDQVREDMRLRDIADATRETSPMRAATDAVIIKTDGLHVDEVVATVLQHAYIEPENED
ncbi:MAG: (d)CMP kinase, partial [Anaerolineae bacterium]|nr:(d)CMP kinase [Anaerolineae bacterium]